MRLTEMNRLIKLAIEEDVTNSEKIYPLIFNLAYYYFRRNKTVRNEKESEELGHLVASDLYMKVLNGKEIYSWISYISRSVMAYIRWYRWGFSGFPETINYSDKPELGEAIIDMSTSSAKSYSDYLDDTLEMDYLSNIINIIDDSLGKSKYYPYTNEWNNMRISLILSINSGYEQHFHQSDSEIMYFKMIYNNVKDKVLKDSKSFKISTKLNNIQLFTLENLGVDSD